MNLRKMKKNSILFLLLLAMLALLGCRDKKLHTATSELPTTDTLVIVETMSDSTVYGICGEGTSMHSLELITADGDTLYYQVDVDEDAHLRGGMMVGDRMAVVGAANDDKQLVAHGVVNLTTLVGRWTSIDRSFEIQEGGVFLTEGKEPQMAEWKICNGRLVLRSDTFSIFALGPDSLCLENNKGIYAYKRAKQ